MFRYTKSHGLVSLQFLGVLAIFFSADTSESKNTITDASLSGVNNFSFDAISDLISSLSFSIKKITLANRDRKETEDAKGTKEIIGTTKFVPLPDPFEQEIADNKFKDLEHEKIKHSYVEPQNKDAQAIETETQATNNEFSELK